MRKIITFFVWVFIATETAIAQTSDIPVSLPTIVSPSPNAASLGRYGEIPVSINTGVPNTSIPLYEVNSGKQKLPISISFHSSGIKVVDQASYVGLGWSLNAGGVITRAIQGIPDEENQPSVKGFINMIFPDDDDPAKTEKEKCLAAFGTNRKAGSGWDLQPDNFYYNFGNKSGKFIFSNAKIAGVIPDIVTIPFDPITINYKRNGFSITDEEGKEYRFFSAEITHTSNSSGTSDWPSYGHATSWYLTDMISADKTDTIHFTYNPVADGGVTTVHHSLIATSFSGQIGFSNAPFSSTTNWTDTAMLLSEIRFKNGYVQFNYNAVNKVPRYVLQSIKVFHGTSNSLAQLVKRFDFFHSDYSTGALAMQVRLDSLYEVNSVDTSQSLPAYQFSYYKAINGKEAPPFNSYAQDVWGYYNGRDNNTDLLMVAAPGNGLPEPISVAYKRKPDSSYMIAGQIQQIRYPAGGTTDFFFEPNQFNRTYWKIDSTFHNIQAHTTTFDITVGNNTSASVQFTVTSALINQFVNAGQFYNAKLDFTGSRMCNGTSNCVANDPIVRLRDVTSSIDIAQIQLSQLNNANPPPLVENISYYNLQTGHTYQLFFTNPGVLTNNSQILRNRLDATVFAASIDTAGHFETERVLTGGMRIKRIISNDNSGKSISKEYNYIKSYLNSNLFNGDFD